MSKNTGLLFSPNPSTSKKTSSNIKGVKRSLADSDYTRTYASFVISKRRYNRYF